MLSSAFKRNGIEMSYSLDFGERVGELVDINNDELIGILNSIVQVT
jgi:hypothetical protein